MDYTINRNFSDGSFEAIVARTKAALAEQGFGVLTEIDVQDTMKKKIDVDVDNYVILGACNPKMAYGAMQIEPRVGAMLPCNVIVRSLNEGSIEVSAIDPQASMLAIDNEQLKSLAGQVRGMLEKVIKNI